MLIPCSFCEDKVDWNEILQFDWNLGSQNCQNSWTCADNVPNVTNLCACDKTMCGLYGDCCLDVQPVRDSAPNEYITCKYRPEINEKAYVYAIESCPVVSDNDNFVTYCENDTSDDITIRTPVYGAKTGFLYKNMYCAICHGEEYIPWSSGISCKWKLNIYGGNYSLSVLKNDKNCKVIFEPPSNVTNVRECLPVVDTCSDVTSKSENEIDRCQTENRTLVFGRKIYKNIHCALCNGELFPNLSCDPYSVQIFPPYHHKRKPINYSYRLLVDLNALTSTGVATSRRSSDRPTREYLDLSNLCEESAVYDPFTEICRPIFCSVPFVYNSGKCVLMSAAESNQPNISSRRENETDETHLSCPFVRLNESEFEIINTDLVLILSTGFIYDKNVSYIGKGFALVCVQPPSNRTLSSEPDSITVLFTSAESILSIGCECLSIVSLCIALTVYVCFPKLQNIPGKNLICLMASLLTAQLLFILAPLAIGISNLCTVIAILMHYAYLAAFFWMNVMAVDIFLTFSKGLARSRGDKGTDFHHFVTYSLYCWLSPACVVTTAVVFDFVPFETEFKPKYGDVVCWISNSNALLYFFLVPLLITVFTNIVLFIFTARAIYLSDKTTSRILQRKQTCKLLIYLKLSSVMGFTWVFACVATFADLPPFWYLFVIFNALQGVFIFLSFVCSKKVLKLLKNSKANCVMFCYTKYDFSSGSSQAASTSARSTKTLLSIISFRPNKPETCESAC